MLAIMHALEKFRQYLVCGRFNIKIDHNSLRFFMNQKDLNDRQQKWVSKIQAYNFDIEYVRGTHNVVANALSRQGQLNTLTSITGDWKYEIVVQYAKDPRTKEIMEGNMTDDEIKIVEELILYMGKILLATNSKVKGKIMKEYHDNPLFGHTGFYKNYKKIRQRYSWKGQKKDVMKYVQECITYQKIKSEQNYPICLLQPLPIPNQKWESIFMNFIT